VPPRVRAEAASRTRQHFPEFPDKPQTRDQRPVCNPFRRRPHYISVTIVPIPLEPPDTVLIRRFLNGDERAFRLLYERHTPRLKMTVQRLLGGAAHDVDDVVQDTWLAGCRGIHAYRGDATFSSWLRSIGARTAFALLSRRNGRETDLHDDVAETRANAPASMIDLERALAVLPDHQRVVVVLHDVEGFTHDEIAEQLGMPVGTSKATLFRARRALRQALTTGVSNAQR
jgi:RNA polymerase sigma-70 factor (ECF subfamily)